MSTRTMLIISAVLVALLSFLCVYFVISSVTWKHTVIVVERRNQQKLDTTIAIEKELIRKDLEQKYAADIVSYNAMAQRLELEKQRARELEEKLKNERTKGPKKQIKKEGG